MRRQQGIGIVALILLLAVLGFAAVIGFKLVPVYLEYFTIKRALVSTVQSPEAKNASVGDLRKAFERRAEVDNIKAVTSAELDITKEGGNPVMTASYSTKVHLFANVSACLDFDATSTPN